MLEEKKLIKKTLKCPLGALSTVSRFVPAGQTKKNLKIDIFLLHARSSK